MVPFAGGTGDLRRGPVDRPGLIDQIELGQHQLVGTERVRLHGVGPDSQERLVDLLNHVRPGLNQHLRAVLLAQIISLQVQIEPVNTGSHRSVEDQNPLFELLCKSAHLSIHISGLTDDKRASRWKQAGAGINLVGSLCLNR